jgi:hypothetical protein
MTVHPVCTQNDDLGVQAYTGQREGVTGIFFIYFQLVIFCSKQYNYLR